MCLYPVLESPFLGGLVVELAPVVLLLPVVKQIGGDIVSAAELHRAAFATHELINHPAFEF